MQNADTKKSYYAVIPADVRYDKRLKPNAKLLYGEITALCNEKGYCWANNQYFANLYEVNVKTISRWISQLSYYKYIKIELSQREGNARKIRINILKREFRAVTKRSLGSDKKVTHNNTKNNSEFKYHSHRKDGKPTKTQLKVIAQAAHIELINKTKKDA